MARREHPKGQPLRSNTSGARPAPIQGAWSPSASGLLLPVGQPPAAINPIDAMAVRTFVLEQELGLQPVSPTEIDALLRAVPFEAGALALSQVSCALWTSGRGVRDQVELARALFGDDPIVKRMARIVSDDPERMLFAEQPLMLLLSLLILHGGDEPTLDLGDAGARAMPRLVTAAPSLADPIEFDTATGDPSWPAVLTFMVRNFLLNARADYASALARTWALHGRGSMAGFASARPKLQDTYQWLKADSHGLAVEDQIALAFALQTEADNSKPPGFVPRQTALAFITSLGVSPDDAPKALTLLAGDRAWFREQLQSTGTDRATLSWNVFPYLSRPFLQREDGDLILLSRRGLESWATSGVYYRLLDSARQRGKVRRFTAQLGEAVEDHALHLTRRSFERSRLVDRGRVSGEVVYGKGGGSKTSDIAVVFPRDLVLIEICSSRITLPSRLHGDEQHVVEDVEKVLIGKVRQLARVIRDIRTGDAAIPGLNDPAAVRIWPLVVTQDSFGATPEIWRLLHERVPEIENAPDVRPLEVLDFEDLEIVLGLIEQDHHLVELLTRKQHVGHRYWDVRRWIAHDPEVHIQRRATGVADAWREIGPSVARRLRLVDSATDYASDESKRPAT
jgi:hypothetical protein